MTPPSPPKAPGARCDICPLAGPDYAPVLPAPATGRTRLVVVSDSPSRHDVARLAPLEGSGGRLVRGELARAGLRPDSYHVTHAALCRADNDEDALAAARCCAPRLLTELAALPPDAPILALGQGSLVSILGVRALGLARGFRWEVTAIPPKGRKPTQEARLLKYDTEVARASISGRTVYPSLSVALVGASDQMWPMAQLDVARAARAALDRLRGDGREEGGPPDAIGDPQETLPLLGRDLPVWQWPRGAAVAVDIETDGIDPMACGILSVGLSDGVRTVVIWPWRDEYAPALSAYLSGCREVTFHNGFGFDLLALRSHGVMW